jgi:hypothetical protein
MILTLPADDISLGQRNSLFQKIINPAAAMSYFFLLLFSRHNVIKIVDRRRLPVNFTRNKTCRFQVRQVFASLNIIIVRRTVEHFPPFFLNLHQSDDIFERFEFRPRSAGAATAFNGARAIHIPGKKENLLNVKKKKKIDYQYTGKRIEEKKSS